MPATKRYESNKPEANTVVLINVSKPFRKKVLELQAPLALMYLSSSLKKAGFRTVVEDITPSQIDQTLAKVAKLKPLFVGISLTFGYVSNTCTELSREIKLIDRNIPIVWGGIHASALPHLCMNTGVVDYVCIGEGERTIVEIAQCIAAGGSPEKIESIAYKKNGEVIVNPLRPFEQNVDNFEVDWECVNLDRYVRELLLTKDVLFVAYQSSRGCPYNCSFCYNSVYNKRRYRPHSIEFVMKDLRMLKERYNITMIQFVDDYFFANRKRALTLLHEMSQIGIRVYNVEIRIPDIDDDLMSKLVEYRCESMYFGLESENERVLEVMRKQITKQDIDNALEVASRYPIKVATQVILGIPSHTKAEIVNTVRYSLEISNKYPMLNLGMVIYSPLPATEMYYSAIEEGYIPPDKIEDYEDFGSPSYAPQETLLSWLPWASEKDKQTLRYLRFMSAYLLRTYPRPSNHWLIRVMKIPFYKIAYWRLYHLNFNCLIDYHIFNLLISLLGYLNIVLGGYLFRKDIRRAALKKFTKVVTLYKKGD